MLVAVHHADVDGFFEHAESFLLAREADHSLVLGLATAARTATADVELFTVDDDGEPVLAALRTPTRPLLITDGPAEAAAVLAGLIARDDRTLHAAHGSIAVAEAFASRYAAHCDLAVESGRHMRLHATSTVATLPTIRGRMRSAEPHDLHRLAGWYEAFHRMAGEPPSRDPEAAIAAVQAGGRLFLWEDEGEPRSMAAWARRTPTTVSINLVYTPPEWRGVGYATACVAALTGYRLADGVRQCLLFTDLENPISNAIYARIGYRPRLDFREFRFGAPPR
jgi:predicted GNAT family acetyltransferase